MCCRSNKTANIGFLNDRYYAHQCGHQNKLIYLMAYTCRFFNIFTVRFHSSSSVMTPCHLAIITLTFILQIHHIPAQLVTCDGGDCSCPPSTSEETCTLECGTVDICKEETLTCRPGNPCLILCNAKASCSSGTFINASYATDVTVVCGAEDSCKDHLEIRCGIGDCLLQCDEQTSCANPGNIVTTDARSFGCIGTCPNTVPASFSPSPTIFYDTMDNITFNWISTGAITNGGNSAALHANSSLESIWLSTSGHQHIELRVTLTTLRLNAHVFCAIYYTFHNTSSWTLLDRYGNAHNDMLLNHTYNLSSVLHDQPRFKIKFINDPDQRTQNGRCVVDEIYIGQPIATTAPPLIHPNITAIFSDNYLKILISITFNVDDVVIISNDGCDAIFADTHLLGADARCLWYTNQMEIRLSSRSSVHLNDDLVLTSAAFGYIHSDIVYALPNDITLTLLPALHPIKPLIMIDDLASTLGICDDLILNAAATQYLGGRNAIFEWRFISSTPSDSNSYLLSLGSMYGDIVLVRADNIDPNSTLSLQVRVTTWFNMTATSTTFDLYKTVALVAHVVLSGPSTFSVTNRNYKHDHINIVSTVSYNVDCMNDSAVSAPYSLSWSVSSNTLQSIELEAIQTVLRNLQNVDHIEIDSSLMNPGNDYIFHVDIGTDSSSLSVSYEYSEIMCSINSADTIYLDSLDYVLLLDGYTMTYDPNALRLSDKSHLTFVWECTAPEYNISCNDLFDTSSLSTAYIKYIAFAATVSTTQNMYRFTLTVADFEHPIRNPCESSLDLILNLKPHHIQYLAVAISVISNVMISDERLRVTVMMISDEVADEEYYEYKWTETSNQLQIINLNEGLNGNLILEKNVLQRGFLYTFQVNVTKWVLNSDATASLLANGVSPTIDIRVLNGPILSQLTSYPNCNQTYQSLFQLLAVKHYLSANADGDHLPLFYQFVYYFDEEYQYYMHPSLLFKPYLFDVTLPFGEFTLKAVVYDSKESSNWNELQCNIRIQNANKNECISLSNDIINPLILSSTSATKLLNDVLQLMPIYLQYVTAYYDDNSECLQSVFADIISVFNDERIFQNINLCETDWSMPLGQIFTAYFEALTQFDMAYDVFIDTLYINGIQSILSLILDPCHTLSDVIMDVDLLFLSPQAIIDGNVIIYYGSQDDAMDITNTINQNLLSNTKNAHVLYELSSSLITIINLLHDHEDTFVMATDHVMDLLSKSLYIHALYSIASSIPGETVQSTSEGFEIYSSRVGVDGDVDVSVHNIQITIDNDVFADGRDSFCDLTQTANNCVYDSVDIVIIAQNNTQSHGVIEEHDPCNDNMLFNGYNGSISNHSISISIIGGNLSTSVSNATITFTDEQFYDSAIQCVWLDEQTSTWHNTGCLTTVHQDMNTIECECNHLTTFSLAYNINFEDECDNILSQMMANSTQWNALHIIFAILFLFVCFYSFAELVPFIIHKKYNPLQDQILGSMTSVFIIALINVVLCISFTTTTLHSVNIQFLTFLLLSPQWFYFIIFGIVLYSWVLVSQSLTTAEDVKHPVFSSAVLSKSLQITTCVLIACGALQFVIVSSIKQSPDMAWIYSASQIFWICLLLLSSIIFAFYGYKTQQIVRDTALMMRTVESGNNTSPPISAQDDEMIDDNVKLSKKLLLTTIVVTAFFLIQCILCIYFLAINRYQHMFYFRILDLVSHYICLLVICSLYTQTFKRLRAEYEIKSLCHDYNVCTQLRSLVQKHLATETIQTRQTAPSVSVTVTNTTTTLARVASHSRSAAKSFSNTSVSRCAPSSQDKSPFDNNVASPPLASIKEVPAPLSHSVSLSLSLIDNDAFKEEESNANPVHVKPIRKPEAKTRVSVFERKELLKLNTAKLAKMCRQQNLSSKGTKADIVQRLTANASKASKAPK
eukprot:15578_1